MQTSKKEKRRTRDKRFIKVKKIKINLQLI